MTATTFWHGQLNNDWANAWVKYWTEERGNFVTSAMEDTGTYLALDWLHRAGKVDRERLLVLRTGSNYTMQHEGISAAESLSGEKRHNYSASGPSLDACWRVGSRVVSELLENRQEYRDRLPGN